MRGKKCRQKKGEVKVKKIHRILTAALFSALLFSCRTLPDQSENFRNPLSLLSADSSIYIKIPSEHHEDLVKNMLASGIQGLSEEDADKIASRTGNIYAGVGSASDRSRLEMVSITSIPKIAEKAAFSEKKGWKKTSFKPNSREYTVYSSESLKEKISLPSGDMVILSEKIEPILSRYDENREMECTEYNMWISQESADILFYITRPGQYMRNLIGQNINIGTDSIYGRFCKSDSGKYNLAFNIHAVDSHALVPLKSLLSIAFSMMGGKITQKDDFTIELSNVEFTEKQIRDFFIVRKKISGKHYEVKGDRIIQEDK